MIFPVCRQTFRSGETRQPRNLPVHEKESSTVVKDVIDFLIQQDPQVGNAVKAEYDRQRRNIELIASENFVSEAVLAAASSVLTNKYAEGYPGKRYYGGCQCVDVVEDIARDRAKAALRR